MSAGRGSFSGPSSGWTAPARRAPAPGSGAVWLSALFPDGKRLAFSAGDGKGHEDIWVRDLERDTASRVTLLPGQNLARMDTRRQEPGLLVLESGSAGIYWIRADGSGVAQRLTDGKIWQSPRPSLRTANGWR